VSATHERLARLKDERLHLLPAHAEHGSDFCVRVTAERKHHQHGALVGWQPLHVLQRFAELLPLLDLIRHAL
jgi:hypothetical protein